MPTGEVSSVYISSIIVERQGRLRREVDPKRIEELADSISRIGLIHFPVITRDHILVSGETRLEALKLLGWDKAPIQWAEELSPQQHLEIEFEENVKRTDLPWQDQVDALRRYHELKTSQNLGWTQAKTAESIGVSPSTVAKYLEVAREIESGNTRVADAPRLSVASGVARRSVERKAAAEVAKIQDVESPPEQETPFLLADFKTWAPSYKGAPFNLIHCDFPYGIDADKMPQGQAKTQGGYIDTPETHTELLRTLLKNRQALMGESAHLIYWLSMKNYEFVRLSLLSSGFWVEPYPLVWHKSDNRGIIPDYQRGPRRIYETALLASYGDRKIVTSKSNLFSEPLGSQEHMNEKPVAMLNYFLSMLVDPTSRLLDPTCGSGSALRSFRSLGGGFSLGLESNLGFFEGAKRAWLL
jgi:ParB-like chromosome segregation protein Spo0J